MTTELKEAIAIIKEYREWENSWEDINISEFSPYTDETYREAIDTVVAELDYLSKYSDELQKTALPHTHKIEVLIRKQQRAPQDMSWFIAEASSIVIKAYNRGFGNGFDEGIKFKQQRKDANKDRKQG